MGEEVATARKGGESDSGKPTDAINDTNREGCLVKLWSNVAVTKVEEDFFYFKATVPITCDGVTSFIETDCCKMEISQLNGFKELFNLN